MKAKYILAGLLLAAVILSGCTDGVGSTGYQEEVVCPSISLGSGVELEQNEFDDTGALYSARNFGKELDIPAGWQIDDDKTIISSDVSCKKGSKEGQNANYWYCAPLFLKKLQTNAEGEIIGQEKISVITVLKKESGLVKDVSLTCYKPKE